MGSGAAAALARPARLHSELEKRFKCPVCHRIFNKKANLKVHSRKHTGEKPYSCSKPGCGRLFMWKSSVTFHEQNCPTTKRDKDPPSPMSVASKGIQKRFKNRSNDTKAPQSTPVTKRRPMVSGSPPTTPMTPEDIVRDSNREEEQALNNITLNLQSTRHHLASSAVNKESLTLPLATRSIALHINNQLVPMMPPPLPTTPTPTSIPSSALLSTSLTHSPNLSFPAPASSLPLPPHPQPQYAESPTLPAPTSLLNEANKRMQSAGRPPVIPVSLPKPSLPSSKDNGGKLYDLRLPSSPVPSVGKPPVIFGSKMPKMPISMELDDSDDEGPTKIIGAQDAFMRTGNPFGGFAPQPRCSPLPVYSPIVCPGISPMPLSPLAPYSPLPPDSPAHNAPNPIHPPLNQTTRTNTNW